MLTFLAQTELQGQQQRGHAGDSVSSCPPRRRAHSLQLVAHSASSPDPIACVTAYFKHLLPAPFSPLATHIATLTSATSLIVHTALTLYLQLAACPEPGSEPMDQLFQSITAYTNVLSERLLARGHAQAGMGKRGGELVGSEAQRTRLVDSRSPSCPHTTRLPHVARLPASRPHRLTREELQGMLLRRDLTMQDCVVRKQEDWWCLITSTSRQGRCPKTPPKLTTGSGGSSIEQTERCCSESMCVVEET